jgi:hypothetical protein
MGTRDILRFLEKGMWRRDRDSNPGDGLPPTHFPGVRLRPLGHLSVLRACAASVVYLQVSNEDQKLANRPCPSAHLKPMFMDQQRTARPRSTYASDILRTSGLRSQMSRWANGISISSSAKRLAISWFISDLTVNTQFTSRRIARISNSSASPPKA